MLVKRLRETRDIAPLISEFFVSDFSPRHSTLLFEEVAPDVIASLTLKELMQCYAAEFNLFYLIFLRFMAVDTPDSSLDIEPEDVLPPGISDLIDGNPHMVSLFGEAENAEASQSNAEFRIQSVEQMYSTMSGMEEAVRLMQNHVIKTPPEESPLFRRSFKQVAEGFNAFKPTLQISQEPSDTLLPDTRVIEINIPFFQLILIRSDSGLKILRTVFHVDS